MDTKHTVKHADDLTFETVVLQSRKPALVDFWAPWCGPCRAIGPIIEELAGQYGARLDVVKVNVDESPKIAQKYKVRSIPTLLFFKDGQVRETKIGMAPKDALADVIDRNLN
jgi:thioredoxin 1